jgi:hypothetical protein
VTIVAKKISSCSHTGNHLDGTSLDAMFSTWNDGEIGFIANPGAVPTWVRSIIQAALSARWKARLIAQETCADGFHHPAIFLALL